MAGDNNVGIGPQLELFDFLVKKNVDPKLMAVVAIGVMYWAAKKRAL